MTIRKGYRGTGITRRPRSVVEPDANGILDPKEVGAVLMQAWRNSQLDHHIDGIEGQARRILAAAGAGPHEEDTPADYARRFIGIIAEIRAARSAGDIDRGIREGIRLGLFLQEHMDKFDFEEDVEKHRTQVDRAAASLQESNARRRQERAAEWSRWRTEAQKVWEDHPTWSDRRVAARVIKNLELSEGVDAVRKRIR